MLKAPFISYSCISYFGHACPKLNSVLLYLTTLEGKTSFLHLCVLWCECWFSVTISLTSLRVPDQSLLGSLSHLSIMCFYTSHLVFSHSTRTLIIRHRLNNNGCWPYAGTMLLHENTSEQTVGGHSVPAANLCLSSVIDDDHWLNVPCLIGCFSMLSNSLWRWPNNILNHWFEYVRWLVISSFKVSEKCIDLETVEHVEGFTIDAIGRNLNRSTICSCIRNGFTIDLS